MFSKETYTQRRALLKKTLGSGDGQLGNERHHYQRTDRR